MRAALLVDGIDQGGSPLKERLASLDLAVENTQGIRHPTAQACRAKTVAHGHEYAWRTSLYVFLHSGQPRVVYVEHDADTPRRSRKRCSMCMISASIIGLSIPKTSASIWWNCVAPFLRPFVPEHRPDGVEFLQDGVRVQLVLDVGPDDGRRCLRAQGSQSPFLSWRRTTPFRQYPCSRRCFLRRVRVFPTRACEFPGSRSFRALRARRFPPFATTRPGRAICHSCL